MNHVDGTDPYPWPYDGDLGGHTLALVVAGAQRHWMCRSTGTGEVSANIAAIAAGVRSVGGLVVAIRHGRVRGAPGARPGRLSLPEQSSVDWQLALPLDDQALVVDAAGLNGFHGSPLDVTLRAAGRRTLVVVGFAAEVCVDSTLRSANDQGYECLVVADACAPLDPDTGHRALNSVTMSGGIFGAVGTTSSLCAALTRPGGTP